jgi:gliding motility-associated-like protein
LITDDSSSCSNALTITIEQANPIILSNPQITPATCDISCDGAITAIPSGGSLPLSILWSGGQTNTSLTGICEGNISVTITDNNGCTSTATYLIPISNNTDVDFDIVDANCGIDCDGSVQITVTGSSNTYFAIWPDGDTTFVRNNLCAGSYDIIIADDLGCIKTETLVINNTGGPTGVDYDVLDVSCFGLNDGSITNFAAIGGNAPFNYLLLPSISNTNLEAGNYTLEVQDVNGCKWIENITITQPDEFDFDELIVDAQCGVNDGSIEISNVTGGSGNYTFTWQGGLGSSLTQQNLAAGVYVLNINDGNCNQDYTFIINTPVDFTVDVETIDVSCNGGNDGEAEISIIGGSGNFTINWSNGTSNVNSIDNILPSNNYFVTVIDDNTLCQLTTPFVIVEPDVLVSGLPPVSGTSCFGICDGSATIQPVGGTAPYTFLWQSGETTITANQLCEGTNQFTLTDNNGCIYQNTVEITSPLPLEIDTVLVQPNCPTSPDGVIVIEVTGGTPIYTYQWNGPSVSNTNISANALSGNYTITVTDAQSCQSTINFTLLPNNPIPTTVSNDTAYCFGNGPVTISGTGGNSIEWIDAESGDVLATTNSITVDPEPGVYQYIYAAYVGVCVVYDTVTVTVNASPTANAGPDISGFIETSVTIGGNPTSEPGNTIIWNPGGQLNDSTAYNPSLVINETEQYVLTVIDPIGCSNTDTMNVTALSRIIFPNGITPNGDGKNDTWIIDNIDLFPNSLVEIYNRWGELLFSSVGYTHKWDGTFNNKPLPVGTYYYVIDLRDSRYTPLTGPITIMR